MKFIHFIYLTAGLLKRKNSGGRDPSNSNSPESSDSDYSCGPSAVAKRPHVESPLTLPAATPSPTDILTRAFPGLSSTVLEYVLKGCNGNVLQAIEVIVQYNATRSQTNGMFGQPNIMQAHSSNDINGAQAPPPPPPPPPPPHVPVPSSGSMPPLFKFNYGNGQYRYLMPPSLMPLAQYMLPTPNGLGLPFPQFPVEMQNHQFKPVECGPETEVNKESANRHNEETKPVVSGYGVCKGCGHETNHDESLCANCTASFNRK